MYVATINGIPVYDALITDEETGMMKISLVDDPAVCSNFLAFDAHREVMMYSIEDSEKRLVLGVVMRADFPIFRRDSKHGDFYVIYKADTIRTMAEKYLLENRQNSVNLMHTEGTDVEGVQMVQCFLKDTANGISPAGFEDIADGSLFAEFHITNDSVWEAVKAGTFVGFSLEGVFDLVPEQEQSLMDEILEELEGLFKKHNKMTKKERVLAALERMLLKHGSITTDKGILIWDGDGDLEVGTAVSIEDSEGNTSPAPDGEYSASDGKTIVVEGGKVKDIIAAAEIPAPSAEEEEPEEEPEGENTEGEGDGDGDGDGEGNEEETPVSGEEETPAEVAADPSVAELEAKVAALEEKVAALEALITEKAEELSRVSATLEKVASAPAAKSAHTEVTESGRVSETGNKKLDRLARVMSAK